jgi:hypothetical protein
MFKQSKYSKYYYNIVNNAKSRVITDNIYIEKHHIIPKSLGGDNTASNLVRLTAREHFICHRLLVRITSGQARNKMVHALWRMCNSLKIEYKVSSKTYEMVRLSHSTILKTVGTGSQFKIGRPAWNKGIPRTCEVKNAISKANKGRKRLDRTSETFTKEWREKISLSARTREKQTCPHCGIKAGPTNFVRWHGESCRNKT